jgi:nitroreductase
MEVLEAILSRRSIRKYKSTKVPEDIVNDVLRAATSAPSATNKQPWHFILISDRELLINITKFHPYSGMLNQAQLAIAVCGDTNVQPDYWIQDCAAATQNILLAAHAKGLGGVWLAIYPREPRIQGLRNMFNIPSHITPLSLVALGFPDEMKSPVDRYDRTRVHLNSW